MAYRMVESCENLTASDLVDDRMVLYNGVEYSVVDNRGDKLAILKGYGSDTLLAAHVKDLVPLCAHCGGRLFESDYESPGSCIEPNCFLNHGSVKEFAD